MNVRVTAMMRCGGPALVLLALALSCAERPKLTPLQPVSILPGVDTLGVSTAVTQQTVGVGDTDRVSALVRVGRDSTKPARTRWSALDPGIVEVDTLGLVTALAPGFGRVQASVGSYTSTLGVTVVPGAVGGTVASENRLPGTTAWLTSPSTWSSQNYLAMWASPYSAGPHDTIDVFIHSAKGAVTLSLYRLGWYGGLGGRLLWSAQNIAASPQPACSSQSADGAISCPWARAARIPIDSGWVSGLYLLKAGGRDSTFAYYPLVLRAVRRAPFVAVVPLFTWQAYNQFGGASLYTPNGHNVSFERPYDTSGGASYVFTDGYSYDLSVLRWLEANKVDVAYESDAELQPATAGPIPLKGFIFIGHSEYWTRDAVDRVADFRNAHKHLAFMSGNNAYWNVRLTPGLQTGRPADVITCYKLDPDPGSTSVRDLTQRFRDPPISHPENALYGIMYSEGTDGLYPLVAAAPAAGSEAAGFLAAAGIQPGDSIPSEVQSEGDIAFANDSGPDNLQVLFKSPFVPRRLPSPYEHAYYTTFFVAPGGAGVFAAGNNRFSRGLQSVYSQPEPKIQALVRAVIDWMIAH